MRDFAGDQLATSRPDVNTLAAIEFCLQCLYADKTHVMGDTLTCGGPARLTFEELIGALLLARDELETAGLW